MKNYSEMTTEELKAELETTKKNFDFKQETWDKIFAIEKVLYDRHALIVHTYNED